ncbi:MAG TPA: flotillin family protein [Myxococcota bacterium]|jgi:hypothetical protein|nr:flotillin family protein [Myxococcota bacterium]
MVFRDGEVAAHARADALERQLAQTKEQVAALEQRLAAATDPRPRAPRRGPSWYARPAPWVVASAAAGAAAYALFTLGAPYDAYGVAASVTLLLCLLMTFSTVVLGFRRFAEPGELWVVAGRPHVRPDGTRIGYRVLCPGQGRFVLPLLERAERMNAAPHDVAFEVARAWPRGDAPVNLSGRARVRFATTEPLVFNAVERFLGRPLADVATVVRQTLESATRGVVGQLPLAAVRAQDDKLAPAVLQAAEHDLANLGVLIDDLTLTLTRADDLGAR